MPAQAPHNALRAIPKPEIALNDYRATPTIAQTGASINYSILNTPAFATPRASAAFLTAGALLRFF